MTTVAFDGTTLAADTRWQSAYIQCHETSKIFRHKNKVCGAAGLAQDAILFRQWVIGGMKEDQKPNLCKDTFCAIVVTDGKPERYESALVPMPAGVPSATGSGCELAMGAMLAGANAKKAVQIASRLDTGTGGKITTLRCNKK